LEGVFGVVGLFLFVDLTTGLIHGEYVLCYESLRRPGRERSNLYLLGVGAGWMVRWLLGLGCCLLVCTFVLVLLVDG
jgi:hypothetical protein